MVSALRQLASVFTLVVFLFPLIAEQVHIHGHSDDGNCTERNSIHYHKMKHHCSICDYVPLASDNPVYCSSIICNAVASSATLIFYYTIVVEKNICFFSLRAPPSIT